MAWDMEVKEQTHSTYTRNERKQVLGIFLAFGGNNHGTVLVGHVMFKIQFFIAEHVALFVSGCIVCRKQP